MQEALQRIDRWHKTRKGYVVFGLVELALAYIVISVAIDTGGMLQYFAGFLLLYGAVSNIVKAILLVINPHGKQSKAKH